ncbi:uncharacterized protein M6D78_011146 isoform 2-T2 [Vipera latastei]
MRHMAAGCRSQIVVRQMLGCGRPGCGGPTSKDPVVARSGSSRDNMRDPSEIDGQLFKDNALKKSLFPLSQTLFYPQLLIHSS